ncbi:MAG: hypothetical protein IRY85_21345, partial [Micromonosporaceae bacterium]|nr:hypothetical protein [Micromonosporaceae bacterium]
MLATNEDYQSGDQVVADRNAVADWARRHILPGEIVCFGAPFVEGLDPETYRVVQLNDFTATAGATYDHAWVTSGLDRGDLNQVAWRLYHVVRPGGTLLLTVPFGVSQVGGERAFYPGVLRRLIGPLFDIGDLLVLDDHIVLVGQRRDEPIGAPTSYLDPEERAFFAHDKRLHARIAEQARQLVESGARFRSMEARSEQLRAELRRVSRELTD